jgi:DNA-binding transcriptional MerR regulator
MHEPLARIAALATTPRYNIKAVVQQTSVHVSTLRAWEQRYGVPQPARSESGHRLYSPRDVAIIRWLHHCTEEGLSISHAVTLLRQSSILASEAPAAAAVLELDGRALHWPDVRRDLIDALLAIDLPRAHLLVNAAILHTRGDVVITELFLPVLHEIGAQWEASTLCVAEEHLIANFIRQRLLVMNQILVPYGTGPRLVCGCVSGEHHELGLLMFATLMELRGWDVLYLGQDVLLEGLEPLLRRAAPALVCFSVNGAEQLDGLRAVHACISRQHDVQLDFAFGGGLFVRHPELLADLPVGYLGADLGAAVTHADARAGALAADGAWQRRGAALW